MKGLPSGYNKDLQEDKEAVFDAEATLSASLDATRAVVSRLSINEDRSGRAASGLLLATDVADYLVSRGMPFRRAHEVVGAMVRRLLAEGRDFSSLTMSQWREASDMFGRMRRGRPPHSHPSRPAAPRSPPTQRRSEPRWTSASLDKEEISGLKGLC